MAAGAAGRAQKPASGHVMATNAAAEQKPGCQVVASALGNARRYNIITYNCHIVKYVSTYIYI